MNKDELRKLLLPFGPLRSWKVGLSYGSMVYFELGEKLPTYLRDGTETFIGSANITLWGDVWTIKRLNNDIVTSSGVSREFVETELNNVFLGHEFLSLDFSQENSTYAVTFSEDLVVYGDCSEESDKSLNLTPLFLPDGQIVGISRDRGLFVSDIVDDIRADYWRSPKAKKFH